MTNFIILSIDSKKIKPCIIDIKNDRIRLKTPKNWSLDFIGQNAIRPPHQDKIKWN